MKVKITKIVDWDIVYQMALKTQGKKHKKQFPSHNWKLKTVKAEHSPLRCLQFIIEIDDVPNYIHNHLSRHIHSQPFIQTMREDLTGIPSNEVTRTTPNNGAYLINGQEILHMSAARVCGKADTGTSHAWYKVIQELRKVEPILARFCVPACVKLGYCKEYQTCGYNFDDDRKEFINMIKEMI